MATQYMTPGVVVEEVSTLPPSVASVSTAIPAFLGYTQKSMATESRSQVLRINNMLEYETYFGGPLLKAYTVNVSQASPQVWGINSIINSDEGQPQFSLYYAMSMYFKNGGGSCYVASLGDYATTPKIKDFSTALAAIEREDEPTIIVLCDGLLLDSAKYYALCQEVLSQCNKLGDRFAVFDLFESDEDGANFRGGIGTNYLKYGAAYSSHLMTTLTYQYQEDSINISGLPITADQASWEIRLGAHGMQIGFIGPVASDPKYKITAGSDGSALSINVNDDDISVLNARGKSAVEILVVWDALNAQEQGGFSLETIGTGLDEAGSLLSGEGITTTGTSSEKLALVGPFPSLGSIKEDKTALYNLIKNQLSKQYVQLASSSAVAGVYARVDRDRGVWKAPANESLAAVIGPTKKINHDEQALLNVTQSGKSINAIRAFTGKGTLVWGARTLAGNDNEWRYVSVRRLFNMIEESSLKATAFAVFEPNDATTWLKVKAMIESFLFGLWERGALAGPTPESAYFVHVGLGKTMTAQNILEGVMNVEIGVAAVRPAEFIVLKFSHKLQEA